MLSSEAVKLTQKEMFRFFCILSKSKQPMKMASFREYMELEGCLNPASRELLHQIFDTAKG
jgi:hypothetical protein